jgi:hypothetical protein
MQQMLRGAVGAFSCSQSSGGGFEYWLPQQIFLKFQGEIPRVKLSKMVIARPKELEPATSKLDRVGPTTTPTVAVRLEYHAQPI